MSSPDRLRLKLRLARQGLGLTQQEVAQKIGVSLRTYQRLESGQTPLDVGTLYQFCDNLNLDFLKLTSPDIKTTDCKSCEFFKTEEEFLNHPLVASEDFLTIKNTLEPLLKKNPAQIFTEGEHLKPFYQVETPLLLADAQVTLANPPLNGFSNHYSEPKWKTASKFRKPQRFITALDLCLKHKFAGFKVPNSLDNNFTVEKFYLMIYPEPANPIILGQVVQ